MGRMKIRVLALLFMFSCLTSSVYAQKKVKGFFKKADRFFSTYVESGRVDYRSLKKDPVLVKALVKEIGEIDLSRTSNKKTKAFYINAYNIFLINNIITRYPLFSPLEEKGVFSEKRNFINGENKSLNELEKLIFEQFKDFRIYAVLSSGTEGCPAVTNFAYFPGKLNRQLKKRMKEVVNDPDYIRVRPKASLILFCESFKTCGKFFDEKEVIKYVNKFRSVELPINFKLGFYPGKRSINGLTN
jgi:hypothetical protein